MDKSDDSGTIAQAQALRKQVDGLLRDVARLPEGWQRERVVERALTLDHLTLPTAAEMIAAGMAAEDALALVEARADRLRQMFAR